MFEPIRGAVGIVMFPGTGSTRPPPTTNSGWARLSMNSTPVRRVQARTRRFWRPRHQPRRWKRPSRSSAAVGLRDHVTGLPRSADRYRISLVTTEPSTRPVRGLQEPVLVQARHTRAIEVDQTDVRAPSGVSIGHNAAISASDARRAPRSRARASRVRPPGPNADTRRLCVISDSGLGLVHETGTAARTRRNSRIEAEIGLLFDQVRAASGSRFRPGRAARATAPFDPPPARRGTGFSASSPTQRTRRLPRWSIVVDLAAPVAQFHQEPSSCRLMSLRASAPGRAGVFRRGPGGCSPSSGPRATDRRSRRRRTGAGNSVSTASSVGGLARPHHPVDRDACPTAGRRSRRSAPCSR